MTTKRRPIQLQLGHSYVISFSTGYTMLCKFIKPTAHGFNFLNLDTNMCILTQHVYPSKCENHSSGDWFWVNAYMDIVKFNGVFPETTK